MENDDSFLPPLDGGVTRPPIDVDTPQTNAPTYNMEVLQRRVCGLYLDERKTCPEIVKITKYPENLVKQTIQKAALLRTRENIAARVEDAIFEKKVPLLKAITSLNLMSIFEWSDKFFQDHKYEDMTIAETKDLMTLTEKASTLARLHEGKSTQNFEMKIQKAEINVNTLIDQLKEKDPFKTYPDIDGDTVVEPTE